MFKPRSFLSEFYCDTIQLIPLEMNASNFIQVLKNSISVPTILTWSYRSRELTFTFISLAVGCTVNLYVWHSAYLMVA